MSLAFQKHFRTFCASEPVLARFADPPALLDVLHAPGGDPASRNALLAALVRRAQAGSDGAVTVLVLALWPGLDAARRRLACRFAADPEALVSELAGRIVDGIHRLDLGRVNRVAATLIRNCERDTLRALQRQGPGADQPRTFDVADLPEVCPESPFGFPAGLDADQRVLRLVDLLEPAIGADAQLVVSIAVVGAPQEAAATALGLGPEAGRKRYQRAIRKLRVVLQDVV